MIRASFGLQSKRFYAVGRGGKRDGGKRDAGGKRDIYKCTDVCAGPTHIFLESLDPDERPYGWERYMRKQPPAPRRGKTKTKTVKKKQ